MAKMSSAQNGGSAKYVKSVRDFDYAMQLTRWLLLPLGLWPTKSEFYKKIVRPVAIVASLSIMLFVIIPLCLFIFIVVKDIGVRLKLIGPLGFGLMSLFKYVAIIAREREVASCVLAMSLDWAEHGQGPGARQRRGLMLAKAKTGRLLTIICVLFMYGGGMPYITVLPLSRGPILRGNVSLRPLAYPGYFVFFDPQVRPIYDFVFAVHCMCGLVRYSVTCGVYSIAIVCIMHICSQIGITSLMLQKLTDNFDEKLLGSIVQQHLRFLKFASKLEEIFNEICLVETFGSTCIICFLGYYLITEYEQRETVATITYFLLLVSFVFNIFILCYIGEILTEQCESIGTSAYSIEWYNLSGREARNITFLIMSTKRPVVLTAGKIMNLSLQCFSNIIKASASYLNMLRTVTANAT